MSLSRFGVVILMQDEGLNGHSGTTAAGHYPNAGISRYRLAKLSGVTQAVISTFVNYKRSARTMDTAAKLATALGLELTPMKKPAKGR